MKRIIMMLFTFSMLVAVSITSFAASSKEELTDDVIRSLSDKDFSDCYDYLLKYKQNNPSCTDDELDALATNFYIEAYQSKGSTPAPIDSFYDDLIISASGMNPEELALSKKYPSDLAAVYSASGIAQNEAEKRYWGGAFLGNKDAFRHTSWNALIICRFYALGKGDYNWCSERTRLWTTAHETGSKKQNGQSDAQFAVDKQMDLLNNAAGRAAAETTYTSEGLALQKVQQYVDSGLCKRIKTDAQTSYQPAQMFAIPTWTLRQTNTAGKN